MVQGGQDWLPQGEKLCLKGIFQSEILKVKVKETPIKARSCASHTKSSLRKSVYPVINQSGDVTTKGSVVPWIAT